MSASTRVRVVVEGRVQGVFFRSTIQTEAQRRGISGWVRNREDGCVEAEFQGPKNEVDELVAVCRQGPDQARVEHVAVEPVEPVDQPDGFTVR